MHSNWAAEHLLVIRTLMERSAIYRRALAPIALALGSVGLLGSAVGWICALHSSRGFISYWSGIGLLSLSGAYLMARRQAFRDGDRFWSAPTRRVTQALLPQLFVGFAASLVALAWSERYSLLAWWLVPLWMVLYGFALHAAGFFMPRGIKLFGWGFVLTGCAVAVWLAFYGAKSPLAHAHLFMGAAFGGFHLAYGVYLSFTEKRMNEP
jgi:hypothetical protein